MLQLHHRAPGLKGSTRASPSSHLIAPCYPRRSCFSVPSQSVSQRALLRSVDLRLARCKDVSVRAEGPTAAEAAANEVEEEADFDLLSTKVADLVAHMDDELKGCSIYLVGMMGSGKSTLGERNRDGPG